MCPGVGGVYQVANPHPLVPKSNQKVTFPNDFGMAHCLILRKSRFRNPSVPERNLLKQPHPEPIFPYFSMRCSDVRIEATFFLTVFDILLT